jgi:NAD(P)-dependent dehydrogenase (short-subunit alcohol dehydrogenase family)
MTNLEAIGATFGLTGKTAVVTGAATGIGRETALLYARAGAGIAALDINSDDLSTLVDENEAGGGRAMAVKMDQGDPGSITAAFAAVDHVFPKMDILLNCAGIYPRARFETATPDFLDRIFDINMRGVFICTQEAVKRMKSGGGGAIVNISSVTSLKAGIYDNSQYGMTKAALNALTVSLALELAEYGIRVNAILPGGIATEAAIASSGIGDPLRGPFLQPGRVPLGGGNAAPVEIAKACLFLASEGAAFITGHLLAVDGGFLVS